MTTYAILTKKHEQIGIQKKEIEVVLALNEDKISIERIAKYTKLTKSEVMEILREHGRVQ